MIPQQITCIRTLFFSATGTTKAVVLSLANHLSSLLHINSFHTDFTSVPIREQEIYFTENDLLIVGVPVYAGRVPNVLLPYLKQRIHGHNTPVIPIVLYGNRNYDDALIELRNILLANGFLPFAAAAMIGEHAFSRILAAGRPDKRDFDLLGEFANQISKKLSSAKQLSSVTVCGQQPVRPYYTPRDRQGNPVNILKIKPVTDPAQCTHCGLCSKICPMGSIQANDVSSILGICIKCCACVKLCPQNAKSFTDERFLYHQHELEDQFTRRAEPEFFL